MADLNIARGDQGYYLNFTVENSDGTAFDLSAYTITFKMWLSNRPGDALISGVCDPIIAASGTCHYLITANDFANVGVYKGEIELTATGVIESTSPFSIEVTESP